MTAASPQFQLLPLSGLPPDPASALAAWLRLSGSREGFALDKTEGGRSTAFIGAAPARALDLRGSGAWRDLRRAAAARQVPGAPPFWTGLLAQLDYEAVGALERLPLPATGRQGRVFVFDSLAILEPAKPAVLASLLPRPRAEALARRLAEAFARLPRIKAPEASVPVAPIAVAPRRGRGAFIAGVRALKGRIAAGDIFQAVLSESFEAPVKAGPEQVYRALRASSPAPYSFWLADGSRDLIGASPERLVRVVAGRALNCPIAGTRPRGRTAAHDKLLERQLLRSVKERAEHLMLVDLARNDLGRVCAPGTVAVEDFMSVRRFSNVMHLVSEVEGRLEKGRTAWDALEASFPAGTVSGAPKVRAMELLAGLEARPRRFYAGALVQADFSGNVDSCIAIRTLELSGGRAVLQAGAGIVADSNPAREYEEVQNKLLGLRRALALAEAAA